MNIKSQNGILRTCTGCGICQAVCTSKAIVMRANEEGFLYPVVDTALCMECDKCYTICPISENNANERHKSFAVYACQAKDKQLLIEATAGGLFPVLARKIIQMGGSVYGAAYNEHMKVVHQRAVDMAGVARFNGSKYVQSDISHVLESVRADLVADCKVLFSGTPCQIDALKLFCSDICSDNLYTLDVVCYGVPSPGVFASYLSSLEEKNNAKIYDYRFRDKHSNGWSHTTVVKMRDEQGSERVIEEGNYQCFPYYRMFARRDCFRRSCYTCFYANLNRCSDITTGNFWGIEKISSKFDTYLGVSMALINTKKGNDLLFSVMNEMICEQRSIDEAVAANDALVKCVPYQKRRDRIYKYFSKRGFDRMIQKYYTDNSYVRTRKALGKIKREFIKNDEQ